MEKKNDIKEALAVDASGQDIYGKAQTLLLKKLVATKMQFGFMQKIDTALREAVGNTADFFEKNNIPDETQELWLKMIGDLAQSINSLGMVAVSYSISRNQDSNLEELKTKAINKFFSSAFAGSVKSSLDQLKSQGLNVAEYESILNNSVKSVVEEVFNLSPSELNRFTSFLNIGNDVKSQMLKVIADKRALFSATEKTVATPRRTPQGQQVQQINPEIAKVISSNFAQYMARIKEKFGAEGLAAMKQALEQEMSK